MTDIVERLRSERFEGGIAEWIATMRQAADEIERLRAIVARVQGAAKTIMIGEADELRRLREKARQEWVAANSLDSELTMNAILTEENERLRIRLENVTYALEQENPLSWADYISDARAALKGSPDD
jgi:hypothetical protein